MNKTSKSSEFKIFDKLANEWWSESGKFKILHQITPLRMEYILKHINQKNLSGLNVLDLGCGGGLICEPLTKIGANVTGIDFVYKNINAAKLHAKKNKLKIDYLVQDLDKLSLKKKYDIIIMFEVLEHMDNWKKNINLIKKFLKKNGFLILSTINRNIVSRLLAINLAENILGWIPRGTHDYKKFIKVEELNENLINENFDVIDFSGLVYNPIANEWRLNKNKSINYFCTAKLS